MVGLGAFTGASLGCALATGEALLIAMRAAQGLGAALMIPAALSIVMNMFKEGAERNKALGIWGGLGAGGGTVGLIAGGVITRYIGWQYIFYLNVPIGTAALVLAPRIVPDSRLSAPRRRFDLAGAIAGTAGLVLLVDALSQAPQYGWGATRTIVLLATSVAVLVAFLVIESLVKDPVVPLSIFRLRTLAAANLAALLLGASFFAFVFSGTLYMQQVLHYSALQTGAAWLAASVTSMALAAVSQLLVTRIGAKVVMADRDDANRRRHRLGDPGASPRAFPGQSRRPVRRRGRRDSVLVHPDLGGRARGRVGASIRACLRPPEHVDSVRRGDWDGDRLQCGRERYERPSSSRGRCTDGTNRRLPPDVLDARCDRSDRAPRDLRAGTPIWTPRGRGQGRKLRGPARCRGGELTTGTAGQEQTEVRTGESSGSRHSGPRRHRVTSCPTTTSSTKPAVAREDERGCDTGARINEALKGQSRAADHKLLTSALRFVSHPRPS